jgi:hypothetical protein
MPKLPNSAGQALMDVPFAEMIRQMGLSIAEAQYALDKVSIRITQLMAGFSEDENGNVVPDSSALLQLTEDSEPVSLLSLGFTPTFYQYVDTVFELKMSISMASTREVAASVSASASGQVKLFKNYAAFSTSVNASYSNKFQYSSEGSSSMRTKLVSLPAPAILEERIRFEMNRLNEEAQA